MLTTKVEVLRLLSLLNRANMQILRDEQGPEPSLLAVELSNYIYLASQEHGVKYLDYEHCVTQRLTPLEIAEQTQKLIESELGGGKPIYYHLTNIGNIYCSECAQGEDTQRYVNDDGNAYVCDRCSAELYDDVRVDVVEGYEVWADKQGYRAQPAGSDWADCSPVFTSYESVEKWINERTEK